MTIINSVIKGKQPVIDTLNVTPTTSAQQITAPQGTDGYSPVNVSAVTSSIDANIVAGNIKKDVQILGVTGSYEGTTPTGTVNITSNGTHNVSSYEYAEVLVPTTAPAYYIEKTKDASNKLVNGSSNVISLSGVEDLGNYVMPYAYYQNTSLTGTIDLSSISKITGNYACQYAFYGDTGITSVDMSMVKTISGNYACDNMFNGSTGITNAKLGSLMAITAGNACSAMFSGNWHLTTINLGSLIAIKGNSACQGMFYNCTGITSVDLSSLIDTSSNMAACQNMFGGCTGIISANISRLAKTGTNNNLYNMFRFSALSELSFNNLAYTTTNINSAFGNMLSGVTGCTVHFPAEWQTDMASYANITNGLGGTNTTVLFDLPNVTTLDLSSITELAFSMTSFGNGNYFSHITGVDLSNLVSVTQTYAFTNGFRGTTSLTNVKFDSLRDVASSAFQNFVDGCTSITTMRFPALKTVFDSFVFSNMLNGVTGCTVHFPSNMSSYNFNCGGTNTTVLYDLPATNILTGADTKEYERNPKYDTATALAWRINGTMPNTTTYYTSGLTDPTVGTTIYSDSACTIAETTVDSVI